jgi:hypothetical protein
MESHLEERMRAEYYSDKWYSFSLKMWWNKRSNHKSTSSLKKMTMLTLNAPF